MNAKKLMKLLICLMTLLCLTAGAAMAQADNSWMPDQYTTLTAVPEERIILGLPEGMVASHQYNPELGLLEYVIDTEKTDWESVLAYSYRADSGQAYINPGVRMPSAAAKQRSIIYFVEPGQYERNLLTSIKGQNIKNTDPVHGYWIGRYDEANSVFMPQEFGPTRSIGVIWYDESGNELNGEFLAFTVSYTNGDAFTVQLPKVPAADITPNAKSHAGVSASKDGNAVRYQADQRYNGEYVYTAVSAPQISGKDTSGWNCYVGNERCEMVSAGEYGLQRRSALIPHALFTGDNIVSKSHTLEWRDENGMTQYVAQLSSLTFFGALNPWPTYAGWTPVPADRMDITYQNPIESGTRMTYDAATGIAYFHITPENLPETAEYGQAQMQLTITPPADASAYMIAKGNGTKAFGQSSASETFIRNQFKQNTRCAVSGNLTIHQPLFETYRRETDDLTLYKSAMMPGEFAAEYTIINWYHSISDAEPFKTEYVFRQMDNCLLQHVSEPFADEDALPDKLTAPVVVIPNDHSAARMQFIAEIYPIESENSRYYELRLVDKNGKTAHLPAKAKIFMSYPEGTSFDHVNLVFNLRHLNSKHQTFETFSVEKGNLHLEENYLWFTPSSLSPFILEWTAADSEAVAPQLPQTGDNSHLFAALTALTAVSAALYMQLKRRRH